MSFNFFGQNSVLDRTIFTNQGPIVKSPLVLLSGSNLFIASPNEIKIPTANFDQSYVGRTVSINGSPNGRNDGVFYVKSVRSFNTLLLDANLDYSDPDKILADIITLANSLKTTFNRHILNNTVHEEPDTLNSVITQNAVDLASACLLLNDIKSKISAHSILVGGPPSVHKFPDPDASIYSIDAYNLPSALLLANDLKKRYESHRQDVGIHLQDDFTNRITVPFVKAYTNSGVLNGPFNWTISDPRNGTIADDPIDVNVLVNGSPAPVDYVYGLLGAIVLQTKPTHGDSVLVDYKYLKNPPTQIERLNSFEFYLNQENNRGVSGVPGHLYRQRSYLLNPGDPRPVKSPISPEKIGYKYKGYELLYTARLNDPGSLLLNSPTNKLMYTILDESVFEYIVRYDPTTLPQYSSDPWKLNGEGKISLLSNPSSLYIEDASRAYGLNPGPPFYSHLIDLTYPSYISAAYRFKSEYSTNVSLEGNFNGVGFGFVIGQKSVIVGGLVTDADNLSSAISLSNSLKAKYTNHINNFESHRPIDTINVVLLVDSYDLESLIRLTNHLLGLYNQHITQGPNFIHQNPDTTNGLVLPPATNLSDCISILNQLRSAFNSHLLQSSVHFLDDPKSLTDRVKQVGILTNRGYIEDQLAWNSFAYDWTIETTYRLYISPDNTASVYLSGDLSPRCSVLNSDLPDSSNVDLKFEKIHEAFFGAIGFNSTSRSTWRFNRIDIQPVDSVQILKNKNVVYEINALPELYSDYPWITVGQGGSESLLPVKSLLVDSTAVVTPSNAQAAGNLTGEYRGYLRIEPSITDRNTISIEFSAYSPMGSFGVDNRSLGVHIGDGTFSTQFCFLQANPSPAIVRGSVYEPSISITTGDTAVFTVDNGPIIVVSSPSNITTVSGLVALFNSAAGFSVASSYANPFTSALTLQLSSVNIGAESVLRIISGSIFDKLGINTGAFVYGNDSKPEYKVSWAGVDIPDSDNPAWVSSGFQPAIMQERILQITDSSTTDFRSYTQSNPLVMNPVLVGSEDWKSDIRVRVVSFTQGGQITSGPNFNFCGVVFNLDEGASGKNVEVHLSKSTSGQPNVVVYSYNLNLNTLDYVASFPFAWDDKSFHSYSLYTDKVNNLVSIFIDGIYYGNFPYAGLNIGAFGPSITFGSGGNAANNGDLTTSQSITEWQSVCALHDSTVNNASLADQRYVGLYRGGDPTKLSSYYLAQIDWKSTHSYKIVRDPVSAVSVYIDGAASPSISSTYDVLTLPLNGLEYLSNLVPSGRFVAFGSFSPFEISRSVWTDHISYSIGKINETDGITPPHQVLNQSNAIVSPEHLSTATPHSHSGFSSYSGGTPDDDFMANAAVPAVTVLGTSTPPFQKSQDLTTMGGLVTTATPLDTISAANLIFSKGQIANFIDDSLNVANANLILGYTDNLNLLIDDTNNLRQRYLDHITLISYIVGTKTYSIHAIPDGFNNVVPGPVPHGNFASLVTTLNALQTQYNLHRSQAGVHFHDDTIHQSNISLITDLNSAIYAYNEISRNFNLHIDSATPHLIGGKSQDLLPFVLSTLNLLKTRFVGHANNTSGLTPYHKPFADNFNSQNMAQLAFANTLQEAIGLYNQIVSTYSSHLTNVNAHQGLVDITNQVINANPTDINSLYSAVLTLYNNYNHHLANNGNSYHFLVDTNHTLVINSTVEYLCRYAVSAQSLFNAHVVDSSLHVTPDATNLFLDNLPFHLNGLLSYCDPNLYIGFTNRLRDRVLAHFLSESHLTQDFVRYDYLAAIADASSQASTINLLVAILNSLNFHNTSVLANESQAHQDINLFNLGQDTQAINALPTAIQNTNILIDSVSKHFLYKPSHVKLDEDILIPPVVDLNSMIQVLNEIKRLINLHYTKPGVHVRNDLVNTIIASDATDLDSAVNLLDNILVSYNAHRTTPGVHSSSAIIRLTPPDGVLYDGIKFWTINKGVSNITSTYSDDETWYIDGFQNQKAVRLTYAGVALPENISIVSANAEPFDALPLTYIDTFIDTNDPIRTYFLAGDTSALNVVNRINSTPGIPANFAATTLDGRIILTNPNNGPGRYLHIDGMGVGILGFDTSSSIPWALTADDISSVSVGVVGGFPDYLSYTTTGAGTRTAYVASTGLTDAPSLGFRVIYRVKINSWSYLPNGETGIYVGLSSKSGPGFTIGIGFVDMAGSKAVVLKDMNNGRVLSSKVFNWGDGMFHEYSLERDVHSNEIRLSIA
jgi:hypothetical protein